MEKAIENFSIAKAILLNTMHICRLQESEGPGLARRLLSWLPILVVLALLFLLLKVGKRYRDDRLMKNREGPNVMSIDDSYLAGKFFVWKLKNEQQKAVFSVFRTFE